jgi:hypothetical protein
LLNSLSMNLVFFDIFFLIFSLSYNRRTGLFLLAPNGCAHDVPPRWAFVCGLLCVGFCGGMCVSAVFSDAFFLFFYFFIFFVVV